MGEAGSHHIKCFNDVCRRFRGHKRTLGPKEESEKGAAEAECMWVFLLSCCMWAQSMKNTKKVQPNFIFLVWLIKLRCTQVFTALLNEKHLQTLTEPKQSRSPGLESANIKSYEVFRPKEVPVCVEQRWADLEKDWWVVFNCTDPRDEWSKRGTCREYKPMRIHVHSDLLLSAIRERLNVTLWVNVSAGKVHQSSTKMDCRSKFNQTELQLGILFLGS